MLCSDLAAVLERAPTIKEQVAIPPMRHSLGLVRREYSLARLRFEFNGVSAAVWHHHDILFSGLACKRETWRQREFDAPARQAPFHFLPVPESQNNAEMAQRRGIAVRCDRAD